MKPVLFALLFFLLSNETATAQIDSAALTALKTNNLLLLQKRIASGIEINNRDVNGANLLMWAVYYSNVDIVKYLVSQHTAVPEKGVIYFKPDKSNYGNLPGIAAGEGKLDVLRYLIDSLRLPIVESEYSPYTAAKTGWSPLEWAVNNRAAVTIKYLNSLDAFSKETAGHRMFIVDKLLAVKDLDMLRLLFSENAPGATTASIDKKILDFLNAANYASLPALSAYFRANWYGYFESLSKMDPVGPHRVAYLTLLRKTMLAAKLEFGVASVPYKNTCWLYFNLKNYYYAAILYKQVINARRRQFPAEDAAYGLLLNSLSVIYSWLDQNSLGKIYGERALKIIESTEGRNNPNYVMVARNLAITYNDLNQRQKSADLYERLIAAERKSPVVEPRTLARHMSELSNKYRDVDNYNKAIGLKEASLAILDSAGAASDTDYAMQLNGLAIMYDEIGAYEKALPLAEKAIAMIASLKDDNNLLYADCLVTQGTIYTNLDQYKNSIKVNLKALKIRKRLLDPNDEEIATSRNNTGFAYERNGDYELAIAYYIKAKDVTEHNRPLESSNYATELHNMARCYTEMGKYDEALPLHLKSLAIQKELVSETSEDYALSLGTLGNLYAYKKDYKNALDALNKALKIKAKTFGNKHEIYLEAMSELAITYLAVDSINKAVALIKESNRAYLDYLQRSNTSLSESEKQNLIESNIERFEILPSILITLKSDKSNEGIAREVFNEQLLVKGIVLQDQQSVFSKIENTTDTETLSLYNQWKTSRKLEGAQVLLSKKQQTLNLDSLIRETELLEEQLSARSHAFSQNKKNRANGINEIGTALHPDEVAIEFIRFDYFKKGDWTDSTMYAALILRKNDTIPKFVPLFEEKQLEQLLTDSTSEINSDEVVDSLYDYSTHANINPTVRLYDLIWKPLEPYLQGISEIYYSPAGLLNQVSFPAIRTGTDSYLIDRLKLNQTTSTVSICTEKDTAMNISRADLWGNINYSFSRGPATSNAPVKIAVANQKRSDRGAMTKGFRGWTPLSASKSEIDSIDKILTGHNLSVQVDSGGDASEENFKGLDGKSPQLIHMATHGFFLAKETKTDTTTADSGSYLANQEDPMLRSGLILAGADYASKGGLIKAGREDGILTAYEIASLNLSNTEMIILSACQTGLGDIEGAEGVYGLQRAFKIARVGKIMMTLWSIDDSETVELMTLFYKNLFSGCSGREALRQAQLSMRVTHPPSIWGAFVIVN